MYRCNMNATIPISLYIAAKNIGLSITCHFINLDKDGAKQGLSIGVSAPNQEFQAVDHLAHSGAQVT